jgi:hypothetical protein
MKLFTQAKFKVSNWVKSGLLGAPITNINVDNQQNVIYTIPVYVGSSKQKFNVQVNTGSERMFFFD